MTLTEVPRSNVIELHKSKPLDDAQPWLYEPDVMVWTDVETGLKCLVRRVPGMGHLCGYVRIMRGHPLYGKDAQRMSLDVHGGVTFARRAYDKRWMRRGYWVGFDCAHSQDLVPFFKMDAKLKAIIGEYNTLSRSVYRDIGFVYRETSYLAQQLKEKAHWKATRGL